VAQCSGPDATRDGIHATWQKLISETKEDDAVVIFYSGHGSAVLRPDDDSTQIDQACEAGESKKLRNEGKLKGKTFAAGNPDAVRITAAARWERAVEFPNESGEYEGILTKALAQAINEAKGQDVLWKTTMAYVSELVNAQSSS
jgi:hypothetical protein